MRRTLGRRLSRPRYSPEAASSLLATDSALVTLVLTEALPPLADMRRVGSAGVHAAALACCRIQFRRLA